jgi:hypothetical protein
VASLQLRVVIECLHVLRCCFQLFKFLPSEVLNPLLLLHHEIIIAVVLHKQIILTLHLQILAFIVIIGYSMLLLKYVSIAVPVSVG